MLKSSAAKQLREARWKQGLSRREVSERTSPPVTAATIQNVEKMDEPDSDYKPLPQTIWILAAALGLDPSDLFDSEEQSA